jgi:YidC/Oxa1 family membrane protein insertase
MEDQGKRLLIAVAVAFAIMVGWSFLFPQEAPKKTAVQSETAPGTTPAPGTSPAPGATAPGAAAAAPGATPAEAAPVARGPETLVRLDSPDFRATFTTHGAALKSWQLLGEQYHDGPRTNPEDLVRGGSDEALWPFQISFPGSTRTIPFGAEWQVIRQSPTEVVFGFASDGVKVQKAFTIRPRDYLVELTITVEAVGATAKQSLAISLGSFQDPAKVKKVASTERQWVAACYADKELSKWSAKTLAGVRKEVAGAVQWYGFIYPYFMAAVALEPGAEHVVCRASGPSSTPGPMLVEAQFPATDVVPGTAYTRKVVGYFGPKYKDKLEAVGSLVGWGSVSLEKSIDLGWLGFLAGPLLSLLTFFYGLFGNWPLAIVLLTVTVKLATLYWTHKSMRSMKEMAKLKPQLESLKEKYKDDRQRQQVETMNLFKEHGVNPMAGCLPMLLQMPIWFALYRALSVAAQLYQAPFLWITDLTSNDPYFILPVFMTGMMLLQSLLTPATATGAQQKMLTYGMPIIFGGMSLFFPAGLTLYIATNSILTLLHHLYMRSQDRKPPVASAVRGGGGGERKNVIDVVDQSGGADDDASAGQASPNGSGGGGKRRPKGRGGKRRGAHS